MLLHWKFTAFKINYVVKLDMLHWIYIALEINCVDILKYVVKLDIVHVRNKPC